MVQLFQANLLNNLVLRQRAKSKGQIHGPVLCIAKYSAAEPAVIGVDIEVPVRNL